jgi:hypothetical protein
MTVKYFVKPRKKICSKLWNQVANNSQQSWLWHDYDFIDVMLTWPNSIDESFGIYDQNQELIAIMPLRRITKKRLWGMLVIRTMESFGGPALRSELTRKTCQDIEKLISEKLNNIEEKLNIWRIEILLPPLSKNLLSASLPIVNPLVFFGFKNTLSQTWILDIRPSLSVLWDGMEGRARTSIKKARKIGIKVRFANQKGDVDIYYRLHCETSLRSRIKSREISYFSAIWDKLVPTKKAIILFAELEGEVIAAANFGIYGIAANYWTGASSFKAYDTGANILLQWHAIEELKNRGIEWYDAGEAFFNMHDGKSKAISDFKKQTGGKLYPYFKGSRENIPKFWHILLIFKKIIFT